MDTEREAVAEAREATPVEMPVYTRSETPAYQPRRRGGGLTGALLLIGLGVLFLLNNLGIVQVNWMSLWRFWPVVLILLGLDLMLGRRSAVGGVFAAVIALAVVGGLVFWTSTRDFPAANMVSGTISEPLGEVSAVEATLNLGAYDAHIGALSGGNEVIKGSYETHEELPIVVSYTTSGDTGVLVLSQEGDGEDFQWWRPDTGNFVGTVDVGLTDQVPLDLTINAGVGDLEVDLTGLNIRTLTIDGGVGNLTVILPAEGQMMVSIDLGVGNLELTIPDGMEARIDFDGGISNFNAGSRLTKVDERWQTSGYRENAPNRIDAKINAGIGNVEIR